MTTNGCTVCAEDSYSTAGAEECTLCPNGKVSISGSTNANDCFFGENLVMNWGAFSLKSIEDIIASPLVEQTVVYRIFKIVPLTIIRYLRVYLYMPICFPHYHNYIRFSCLRSRIPNDRRRMCALS